MGLPKQATAHSQPQQQFGARRDYVQVRNRQMANYMIHFLSLCVFYVSCLYLPLGKRALIIMMSG